VNDNVGDLRKTDQDYQSYLMRLLRTQSGEAEVWRVSLEDPLTEQMHRFDDLPSLFAFLLARTGQERQAGGPSEAANGSQVTDK